MKITRRRKKYTKEQVLKRVCDYGLVEDNWPGDKTLTTLQMVKIAKKLGVIPLRVDDLILIFDNKAWCEIRKISDTAVDHYWDFCVNSYIEGELTGVWE